MEKKAVSPVIATILLIAITIVLAAIIFLWARGFVSEKNQKQGRPIESFCQDIKFNAEVSGDKINIVNQGNVPIYAADIKKVEAGAITDLSSSNIFSKVIRTGETGSVDLPAGVNSGDEIKVIPEILGTLGAGGATTPYACADAGVSATV